MSAVTHVIAGLHLFDDFSARSQQREQWSELCRWGAAAIGFLCLTSSIAAALLALLDRV